MFTFFFPLLFVILETRYCDSQTQIICQSYDPKKLMFQLTPMGPTRFWCFISQGQVFGCLQFSISLEIINIPLSHIVTQSKGMQLPHFFLEISFHRPSQFISILYVRIFQFFEINEMKCLFLLHLCIYGYICIMLCSCLSLNQWYQSSFFFLCFSLHVPNEVTV